MAWGSSLQTESKVTRSRPGSFSTLIIWPAAWVEGNFNLSWVLWTREASQVPVNLGAGSPAIGLVWGTLNSSRVQTSFAGAWRWSRLLTFLSGQSQEDFGTRKFPSPETRGPKPFDFISYPGFEAATLLYW